MNNEEGERPLRSGAHEDIIILKPLENPTQLRVPVKESVRRTKSDPNQTALAKELLKKRLSVVYLSASYRGQRESLSDSLLVRRFSVGK
ncbi:hypothetical protein GOBAR_DD35950 [Gossypium barbadense]|nr:hypothetical protein GOBAR_DD35950 [Gossypium barbadense]